MQQMVHQKIPTVVVDNPTKEVLYMGDHTLFGYSSKQVSF